MQRTRKTGLYDIVLQLDKDTFGPDHRYHLLKRPLRQWITATLEYHRVPPHAELSVRIVSPGEMHYTNCLRKGINRPTDVLSFVAQPETSIGLGNSVGADAIGPLDGLSPFLARQTALDLGEVFLCPDYMEKRLLRYPEATMPFPAYVACTIVHSVLHCLGYTHHHEEDYRAMVKAEKRTMAHLVHLCRHQLLLPIPDLRTSSK